MKISILKYFLFACIAIVFASCTHEDKSTPAQGFSMSDTMMSRCQFTKVISDTVKSELTLFGKVQADNNKLAHVYPIVGGNVIKINVELGDYVHQGDILAVVQSSEVAELQKEKLHAINDLAIAEKNYEVAKDLYAGKLNSEKDMIAAEKELQKAKAEVQRMNEVYKIYHLKDGSTYNIIAPLSGFIVSKNINQNEQLRADNSEMLFSIAEIKDVWIIANVNESDINRVKLGYDASVHTISFPDRKFNGKIDKIFNAIDPETKAMKVRIKIPNDELILKPEMNATVVLHFKENHKMIAIPSSSVIFDKSKNWVMVFKDRTHIETRQVDIAKELKEVTYIRAGLKEGETIISKNGLLIYDALND